MKQPLRIAAIVLAAGQSKRMGLVNKLLMDIEGIPMVERVVSVIQAVGVEKTLVVTGYERDRIEQCLNGYDIEFVWNADYEAGMGTSLAAGAKALAQQRIDGILVCLGDLPYLEVDTMRKAMDCFYEAKSDKIVVPVFQGKRGHPVIFPVRYRPDLEGLKGDAGARALIEQEAGNLLELDLSDQGTIRDLDTM